MVIGKKRLSSVQFHLNIGGKNETNDGWVFLAHCFHLSGPFSNLIEPLRLPSENFSGALQGSSRIDWRFRSFCGSTICDKGSGRQWCRAVSAPRCDDGPAKNQRAHVARHGVEVVALCGPELRPQVPPRPVFQERLPLTYLCLPVPSNLSGSTVFKMVGVIRRLNVVREVSIFYLLRKQPQAYVANANKP